MFPMHFCVSRGFGTSIEDIEQQEFAAFAQAISKVEQSHDFVVIDTPGSDSYLMRLAHSMADTLITPLNDSFVDFDVLGMIDQTTFEVAGVSHYAEMVREARRQRRMVDGGLTDWVVVRNRLSTWARGTGGWSGRASRASPSGSASAASTALPNASSIANSSRAA